MFKGHQRAPADEARVKCLCGVVTSALSIVFALGQHPPLDDSGSSFTDLRVVYHLIIIALSHYFLCCILWALSLNQALNHYYILFSLSHIIFAVHTKAFIKSMNKRETFCSCCYFLLCRNCPTIIVSLLIHILYV